MADNRISVIVPVYNLEEYVGKAVRSILDQSYKNIEIILVNDGSKDQSGMILDQLKKIDERIVVIHKQNEGVTKARLTGVKVATGDWIGFVDGDDYIDPDMYEHLLKNAREENAFISHCGYKMVFPNRVDYYYNSGNKVIQDRYTGIKDLISGSYIEPGLVNKLFRKELFTDLDEVMDFSIKNTEDLLMNYYLFKKSSKSVYEDFCPYHYIVRKGSAATAAVNENKLRDPLHVFSTILKDTEYPDVSRILEERMIAQLINQASAYDKNSDLISGYRRQAKKELWSKIPLILKGKFNISLTIRSVWCSIWPRSYNLIHKMYSHIKGTDKKFDV